MTDAATDRRFMDLAIALGRRGLGQVWPNPAVGCVILSEGRVVGRGWTAPGGRPHAETQALSQAGGQARGATAYVSLEPCAHHGKTPPCAEALIAAGVVRVVTALEDPDPRVAGRGHAMLRDAGISVTTGVAADAARAANEGFLSRVERGRPWLTLKLAFSLDGRIATATGESQWITGPEARRHVHALRLSHDAVMVGAGTARADDPSLTVRGFGPVGQPVRVVLSRHLNLPAGSTLARTAHKVPVWLCHGGSVPPDVAQIWTDAGATLVDCDLAGGQLNVGSVLGELGRRGLTRVFCEGGGDLAASLLQADLVDEIYAYSAGLALGAEARPGIGALGLDHLGDARRFELAELRPLGGDILHRWRARLPRQRPA